MRKSVPARVTVIAILHFVFGGLGVLQGICAGSPWLVKMGSLPAAPK
jgi:hypothetical protein